jgi:hypothetical protein
LEKAEANSKWWRKESGRQKEALARAERQVRKLSKRLEKDAPPAKSAKPVDAAMAPAEETPTPTAASKAWSSAASDTPASATPDASWTVVQLRNEARSRGLTGLSNKSKAELLTALG